MARLMLMGIQECNYPAVIIMAWSVVDSRGQMVCGAHSEAQATASAERFRAANPGMAFHVVGPRG